MLKSIILSNSSEASDSSDDGNSPRPNLRKAPPLRTYSKSRTLSIGTTPKPAIVKIVPADPFTHCKEIRKRMVSFDSEKQSLIYHPFLRGITTKQYADDLLTYLPKLVILTENSQPSEINFALHVLRSLIQYNDEYVDQIKKETGTLGRLVLSFRYNHTHNDTRIEILRIFFACTKNDDALRKKLAERFLKDQCLDFALELLALPFDNEDMDFGYKLLDLARELNWFTYEQLAEKFLKVMTANNQHHLNRVTRAVNYLLKKDPSAYTTLRSTNDLLPACIRSINDINILQLFEPLKLLLTCMDHGWLEAHTLVDADKWKGITFELLALPDSEQAHKLAYILLELNEQTHWFNLDEFVDQNPFPRNDDIEMIQESTRTITRLIEYDKKYIPLLTSNKVYSLIISSIALNLCYTASSPQKRGAEALLSLISKIDLLLKNPPGSGTQLVVNALHAACQNARNTPTHRLAALHNAVRLSLDEP